jgi:dihydropyrimidinase
MARRAKELGMPTMKLYTTYVEQGCFSSDAFIDSMLEISRTERVRVLVHAENDGLLRKGKIPVRDHEPSRPALAEISEVVKLAEMAHYRDGWLYIVHVSCGATVDRLRENYSRLLGTNVILESCPHYFLLSAACYQQPDGYLFTMTPPLRDRAEAKRLGEEIDAIHTIGSDHCAFLDSDKKQEWTGDIPMGIGGMDHSFALMHQLFGSKIIDKFTKNVAQIHGLYPRKGTLLPGADADIVVYDPSASGQIQSRANIHSPYAGMVAAGKVQDTLCHGEFVVHNGVFLGGQGQYLNRALDE